MQSYFETMARLAAQETPCVTVTLVHAVGSAPQNVGAKMIVEAQGRVWGTVGGGKVENHCIAHSQGLLSTAREHDHQIWNLQRDIGMTCGGVAHFFFEVHFNRPWTLAVFGAGHVSQALIPLLVTLPCQVLCFDTRAEWIARLPQHPRLRAQVVTDLAEQVSQLPEDSFVISMTHGHAHDVPVLHAVFLARQHNRHVFPYVGVIGSKAKAGAIHRDLRKQGHSKEALQALWCPIGLPLGSNLPAEIAVSIAAQVIQERDRLRTLSGDVLK